MKIKYFALLLLAGGLWCACQQEEPVEIEEGKYGSSRVVTLGNEGGIETIEVSSKEEWTANLTYSTRTWATLEGETTGKGPGHVTVKYRTNRDLPRRGAVLIANATRETIDTVWLNQYGVTPEFLIYEQNSLKPMSDEDTLRYSCVASADSLLLETAIPVSELEHFSIRVEKVRGPEDVSWVHPVLREGLDRIAVQVDDNTEFEEREAQVFLEFTDSWGETYSDFFRVIQGIPGGTATTALKSFAEVKGMLGAAGSKVIEDDISIEGFIVSEREGCNMGDCPRTSKTAVDWSLNDRTVYIENDDASSGFRLITNSLADNQTVRYSKSKIWLKGLTLTREDNPVRYTLSGVGAEHYISSVPGTAASIPEKNRYIRDLKDDDIYTLVTLKRCEYPIRRGSLCNFNTGYENRMPKHVQVLADIHGDWIWQMFNLKCNFVFSKDGVPKGQGRVTGIIVHETCAHVNPEEGNDIGRYQIRSAVRSDIAVSQSANDSFTSILTEWADNGSDGTTRRVHSDPSFDIDSKLPASYWGIQPTSGKGFFYHCKGLWPLIAAGWVNPAEAKSVSNSNYGFNTWYDKTAHEPNYAIWRFSTKDIQSPMVTLCFAVHHHSQTCPPMWAIEYSKDEGETWTRVGDEFFVPPVTTWSPETHDWQISGEQPYYYVIPNDILGLDVAMIRMIPSRDLSGTASSWNGGKLSSENGYMDIAYSAIRYRK